MVLIFEKFHNCTFFLVQTFCHGRGNSIFDIIMLHPRSFKMKSSSQMLRDCEWPKAMWNWYSLSPPCPHSRIKKRKENHYLNSYFHIWYIHLQLQRHFQADTLPWIQRMRQKEQGLQRRLLRVGSFIILYLRKLWMIQSIAPESSCVQNCLVSGPFLLNVKLVMWLWDTDM